ncbi:Spy Predicted O-linked N-acetylglucosamine transferase, SPINDLY family [Candidatus Methylopumilus planktonicus]|uniref:O-linked N-acetylglucosamine transferase, SPINDLY family protein n=1 Tax=Candidatus Methylopumilus planktonicus TaxID=1581557 RepID=UPI003BEEC5AF
MSKILIQEAKKYESEGNISQAIISFKKALQLEPENYIIQLELGNLCASNKQFEEAAGYFRRCLYQFKDNIEIKNALCFSLTSFGNEYYLESNFQLSEACFEEVLEYEKNNWVYYYNLANTQDKLNKISKAYENYQKAIQLNPNDADLWNNNGNSERKLGYLDKALISYENALKIKPALFHALVHLTHQKQHMCNWHDIDKYFQKICSVVNTNAEALISPFAFVANPLSSSQDQLICANQWTQNHFKDRPFKKEKWKQKNKVRIGYLSSDFKLHPLYFLIRDVIRYHNRDIFDIYAYDASPHENTNERNTLISLFDFYRDISSLNDEKAISLINNDEIDIFIDLTGYTNNSRAFIAPQLKNTTTINWLGYPGSMGLTQEKPLYDFILADDFIIPENDEKYYAESILRLPFAYQPNIENRYQLNHKNRQDYGIPSDAFVYCAFNQSFKITEFIFKAWLTLLEKYPKSILWLTESNSWATNNLKNYAGKHGINSERIIFAKRVPNEEHIARHALADIYLDTLPYNAHTSASDALAMNIPIVTLKGKTFPSRVAGSLLHSLNLDDLIAEDIESYIKCASKLTEDSTYRQDITRRLIEAKSTSPNFKPQLFVKTLENIYQKLI